MSARLAVSVRYGVWLTMSDRLAVSVFESLCCMVFESLCFMVFEFVSVFALCGFMRERRKREFVL